MKLGDAYPKSNSDVASMISALARTLGPNEAGAEMIPLDRPADLIMRDTLKGGGQQAETLRMGMLMPDKVRLSTSDDMFDEYMDRLAKMLLPKNAGIIEREGLAKQLKMETHGYYSPSSSFGGKAPPMININRLTNFPLSQVLGHETGHFLIDALKFQEALKGRSDEDFADFLGGFSRKKTSDEPWARPLATKLYQEAQKKKRQ